MPERSDHAVVVGAGIAGLLAARALAERFGQVTVLDRDELPDQPVPRVGVPQGRHPHRIPDRGRRALDELLPGLSGDLSARGRGRSGGSASRPLLEWAIRQRVAACPRVRLVARTAVLDLDWAQCGSRVAGVRAVSSDDPSTAPATSTTEADLVVDASGRDSRLGEWLHRAGHPEPRHRVHRVDLTVVTRRFRRDGGPAGLPDLLGAAVVQRQEDGGWAVSLAGYHGERPPVLLEPFRAAAPSYGGSRLGELLDGAEPLDEGTTYRFPASRRRDVDRTPLPPGVLVVGDAVCTLDPLLGQGVTLAALEAIALRDRLPGPAYHRTTARLLDRPWQDALHAARPAP